MGILFTPEKRVPTKENFFRGVFFGRECYTLIGFYLTGRNLLE